MLKAKSIPYNPDLPECYNYGIRIFDIGYPILCSQIELVGISQDRIFESVIDPYTQPPIDSRGVKYSHSGISQDIILALANSEYLAPRERRGAEISNSRRQYVSLSIAKLVDFYKNNNVLRLQDPKDAVTIHDDINLYVNAVERQSRIGIHYRRPPQEDLNQLLFLMNSIESLAETIEFYTEDKAKLGSLRSLFSGSRSLFKREKPSLVSTPKAPQKDLLAELYGVKDQEEVHVKSDEVALPNGVSIAKERKTDQNYDPDLLAGKLKGL